MTDALEQRRFARLESEARVAQESLRTELAQARYEAPDLATEFLCLADDELSETPYQFREAR